MSITTMETRSLIDLKNPLDPMDTEAQKRGIRFVIVNGDAMYLPVFQKLDKASLVNSVVIVVTQYNTKKRHDIWVVGTYTPNGTWTLWRYFVRPPADQARYVPPKAATDGDIHAHLASRFNDAGIGLVASGNNIGMLSLEDLCNGNKEFPLHLNSDDDSLLLRCQVKYMKASSHITDFYINVFDEMARRVRVSWSDFMYLNGLNGDVLEVWAKHRDGSFTVHFVGDMYDLGTFMVPDPDKVNVQA